MNVFIVCCAGLLAFAIRPGKFRRGVLKMTQNLKYIKDTVCTSPENEQIYRKLCLQEKWYGFVFIILLHFMSPSSSPPVSLPPTQMPAKRSVNEGLPRD